MSYGFGSASYELAAACACAVVTLIGLVAGDVACFWTERRLRGEPFMGRPRCAACGRDLDALGLVPVLGWLTARGRCRSCGEKMTARRPVAELICAVSFAAIAGTHGPALETIELLAFAFILLLLSLIDIDERIIPDGCIGAALAVRAVYLTVALAMGWASLGQIGFYVLGALAVGIALLLMALVADKVVGRESIGGGDLKLFAVSTLYFGWEQGLLLVFLSCLIALVGQVLSLVVKRGRVSGGVSRSQPFPFGPSIAVACVITMIVDAPFSPAFFIGS